MPATQNLEQLKADMDDIELGPARERALTFTPNTPENAPIVLTFADLNVRSKKNKDKFIIKSASGSITGGFWAIMGSSGSGKTTLLSTLSCRLDAKVMDIEGDLRMNGKTYSTHLLKEMSAYVMQDDLLHPDLTVGETLYYASYLRLPKTFTQEDRDKRSAEVLQMMGITHCKNTIVGTAVQMLNMLVSLLSNIYYL